MRPEVTIAEPIKLAPGRHEGQRPRFAIVSAVYNVARYLADFIESVERQSFDLGDVEVIMVDDGSTDESLEMLRSWEQRRPELVRILTKENGGQASARNLGLDHATAEWITFLDPDDWVDDEYFQSVHNFLEAHGNGVDMVATNRIFFEEGRDGIRDGHPLRRMFRSDQLVSLLQFPTYFQGSVPASFLRLDVIERLGLRFDVRIRPNFEDGHFCVRYLLEVEDPRVGFLKSAEYYYRKRADNSSTLATSVQQPGRFIDVPRHGYLDVFERATQKYGVVPEWLQNMVLYELSWYFSAEDQQSGAASAAVGEVGAEFVNLLGQLSQYFDEIVVRGFDIRRYKQVWRDILLHGVTQEPWHTPYVVLQDLDRRHNMVRISYRFTGEPPTQRVLVRGRAIEPEHTKIRTYEFFGQTLLSECSMWVANRGTLRVQIEGSPVELRTDWIDDSIVTTMRPSTVVDRLGPLPTPPAPRRHVLRRAELRARTVAAAVRDVDLGPTRTKLKNDVVRRLGRSRSVQSKFANAWVLMDRIHDANDSAETLFHYLRDHRPDINAWFVLEEGTPDWNRLQQDGCDRLVAHGSLKWKLLMLNCEKLISSHIDVPVHQPPEILELRPPNWDFVFLQHGVIKDDISRWLNSKELALFVTSTPDEYESIAGDQSPYAFTSKEVVLTGLPRFDALQAAADRVADQPRNLIIIAPTWRHWLLAPLPPGSQRRVMVDGFQETEFVQNWKQVLQSDAWRDAEWAKDFELVLLPHPNLVSAVEQLGVDDSIEVLDYADPRLHEYFARAAVLVTDFSSMAFNAAYLRRPVVYFQFDRQAVMSGGHVGRGGYFDYDRDGFGPVVYEPLDVLDAVGAIVQHGGASEPYASRIEDTFPFRDGRCSERVAEAIEAI
jgi:glycosyltransferase involved in cell wall biosynthesis